MIMILTIVITVIAIVLVMNMILIIVTIVITMILVMINMQLQLLVLPSCYEEPPKLQLGCQKTVEGEDSLSTLAGPTQALQGARRALRALSALSDSRKLTREPRWSEAPNRRMRAQRMRRVAGRLGPLVPGRGLPTKPPCLEPLIFVGVSMACLWYKNRWLLYIEKTWWFSVEIHHWNHDFRTSI